MFQSFDDLADGAVGPAHVKALRRRLADLGIDAVLVPRADAHQGEYVPADAERLRWLTGFTGSAGMAIVTRTSAALFTDGRYTLQATAQVDGGTFEVVDQTQTEWIAWLGRTLSGGGVVGYDPWLHTAATIETAAVDGASCRLTFKALAANPIDSLWGDDRPPPAQGTVTVHPVRLAGRSAEDKIADVQKALKEAGEDAVVLTLPENICWLFNIRGRDIPHTPSMLAFAVVPVTGKPELFVHPRKIAGEAATHLARLAKMHVPGDFAAKLAALKTSGKAVRADPATAAVWVFRKLGKSARRGADPIIAAKARKTSAELDGARAAHKRDGAVMCRYLAWLDRDAASGRLDEITACQMLEQMRADTQQLKDLAFDTISGSGPNGAIVHYRVTRATNRHLKPGELFLVDSGAQYEDGTTDVTRTIAIGRPTREMAERYTLVLKGHLALAAARFPKGTKGIQLDTFARAAMWSAGLDYDHGTGHGVGSFLSVHEGPQSISKRGTVAALETGMIVSNEPGYYRVGAFGIRIENLEIVTPPVAIPGGERDMHGFETLTLVPYDRRLIVLDMLTASERTRIDAYHARVRAEIGPDLRGADRGWLDASTAPL